MNTDDKHFLRSSEREEYLEYIFLAEICSHGWSQDRFVEVARAHTDAFGYDLVLSCGEITRHTQLKASLSDGRSDSQKVSLSLSQKPSGCVIWMKIDRNSLKPMHFGWFGATPGQPLPDLGEKVAKHTKADSHGRKNERPGLRELRWSKFEEVDGVPKLFECLFGPARN